MLLLLWHSDVFCRTAHCVPQNPLWQSTEVGASMTITVMRIGPEHTTVTGGVVVITVT